MSKEGLYKVALTAIQDIFSDTSVTREATAESLRGLRDEIDILLETLD